MSKTETIDVYWAPATFLPTEESWAMLYQEPKPVLGSLIKASRPKALFTVCPAVKDTLSNVFSLTAAVDDEHKLPGEDIMKSLINSEIEHQPIPTQGGFLPLYKPRKSSIDGYVNVTYGMRWVFFAAEPLMMRLTAPYFPATSPTEGALLAAGEFDIGRWFRQINLDWHIPASATKFTIKNNDPLAFIEFQTRKKINLVRFNMNNTLMNLAFEASDSTRRYGKYRTLLERYQQAHGSKVPKIVLAEIRKNLAE